MQTDIENMHSEPDECHTSKLAGTVIGHVQVTHLYERYSLTVSASIDTSPCTLTVMLSPGNEDRDEHLEVQMLQTYTLRVMRRVRNYHDREERNEHAIF